MAGLLFAVKNVKYILHLRMGKVKYSLHGECIMDDIGDAVIGKNIYFSHGESRIKKNNMLICKITCWCNTNIVAFGSKESVQSVEKW